METICRGTGVVLLYIDYARVEIVPEEASKKGGRSTCSALHQVMFFLGIQKVHCYILLLLFVKPARMRTCCRLADVAVVLFVGYSYRLCRSADIAGVFFVGLGMFVKPALLDIRMRAVCFVDIAGVFIC